jgi:hypothetical protein
MNYRLSINRISGLSENSAEELYKNLHALVKL